jgi:hypothetical protein
MSGIQSVNAKSRHVNPPPQSSHEPFEVHLFKKQTSFIHDGILWIEQVWVFYLTMHGNTTVWQSGLEDGSNAFCT